MQSLLYNETIEFLNFYALLIKMIRIKNEYYQYVLKNSFSLKILALEIRLF